MLPIIEAKRKENTGEPFIPIALDGYVTVIKDSADQASTILKISVCRPNADARKCRVVVYDHAEFTKKMEEIKKDTDVGVGGLPPMAVRSSDQKSGDTPAGDPEPIPAKQE